MSARPKNICIVPVKGTSSRLPKKNFLKLGANSLWEWTVASAIKSNCFSNIVISTDTPEFFSGIDLPSNVVVYKRDTFLCKENVHSLEVVLDVCQTLFPSINPNSIICMALVTSPFRKSQTFEQAIEMCSVSGKSVIGVTKASKGSNSYRQKNSKTGIIETPDISDLNRQSTDICEYIVTGSVFMSPLIKLKQYKSFHQPDSIFIELDDVESLDINTRLDFEFAQFLLNNNYLSTP